MRVKDLTKQYDGKTVVDSVSFEIPKGKVISMIGPNGAGKSTVLNIISRLIARDSGLVDFDGRDIGKWKSKELAKRLAILTQSNNIQMKLTVRELVTFGRFPYSGSHLNEEDQRIIDKAIAYMELEPFQDRFIDELSGGQRQRAYIAMVIAQDTEFILLDEPTSHLDVKYKLEFLSLLREMARKKELSVIMSLHELDLAERISDRVVCIKDGRMDRCGTPEEIFSGGYIRRLYGVERGSYCESFGCPELEPIRGAPQIFVIGGNGTGIPVYRRLQRQGVPFAAGILPENDVDHPVASALAVEVIAQRAYHPIGEDTFQRALSVLERCSQVLCCLREFGPLNEANRRLAQAGGDRTVYLDDQPKPKPDFCQ
mgnify:CR=1 FL=1